MEDKQIKEEIAQYWDSRGGVYDTQPGHGLMSKEEKDEWLKFLRSVLPEDTKRVLDVGGGTGFLTLLLAELGIHVKSIDLSSGMQADAKRKAVEWNLTNKIEFAIADAEATGEADESFDAVVNRHLLWTLPHPAEAVDEWLRVIRSGGRIIVIDSDWNRRKEREENMSEEEKAEAERKRKEHEEKFRAENKKWYSDELRASLPMSDTDRNPIEFFQKDGCSLEIKQLEAVEEAERKAFEKLELDDDHKDHHFGRCAYILTKN